METMEELKKKLKFDRKNTLAPLVLFFLCWHPGFIGSESLTLTTYYPAPYGGYVSLLTTQNTILARDGGNVAVGSIAPMEKLHVTGNMRASGNVSADNNLKAVNMVKWGDTVNQLDTDQGGSIEIGGNGGTPYIDFHRTIAEDYSARLILSQPGRLQVVGDLEVTGTIINVCERVGYSVGGTTPCLGGKRVVGFMGDGVARVTGFLPGSSTTSSWGTFVVLGEDWGGTMVCCKF